MIVRSITNGAFPASKRLQLGDRAFVVGRQRLLDKHVLAMLQAIAEQVHFCSVRYACQYRVIAIERNVDLYARNGFGFWLIESRDTSTFLGYCGIRPLDLDGVSVTEIGWHTKKTVWNRGIATEAAAAVRDMAFHRFDRRRLVALIRPGHDASVRVALKIGMREQGAAVVEGDRYVTYVVDAGRD